TTAEKKAKLREQDAGLARDWMCTLNRPGSRFGKLTGVRAMTDVTGFGLLGHLVEMAEGAQLTAQLDFAAVPRLPGVDYYLAEGCIPGGTLRNFDSYGDRVAPISDEQRNLLCDPQTSGGLLVVAIPTGLLASRALSLSTASRGGRPGVLGQALRWPVRALLIFLRSVPEIVWALLFVRAVGLGPTAGVLAIAVTYAGMLGKVYAEIFESVDRRPMHALLQAGAGRLSAFCYGILPNAAAELTSYTVYRWECAIRASVVMGFVGAGGLGQQIDLSLRMFAGDEVASMLLTFLLLVLLADGLSRVLRGRLA